jgi:hypothetical protein
MRTEITAIRSKPPVSLLRAVGSITLKADDLSDSAILTAFAASLMHGRYPALKTALAEAAKSEWHRMMQGDEFTMVVPKPKANKR